MKRPSVQPKEDDGLFPTEACKKMGGSSMMILPRNHQGSFTTSFHPSVHVGPTIT